MLKVLHTADWHLGQTFMQKSRIDEHQLFLQWLLEVVKNQEIDSVIVAGDIFDVTNPSIEAMDLYHHFLLELFKLNVNAIIVGGNHDSAARLNSTGGILKMLNVHVVGGDVHHLGELIPLTKKGNSKPEVVVCAIPYLRDGEIRKIALGENIQESHQLFLLSVKKHYDFFVDAAKEKYSDLPIIATGHLYVHGSMLSDISQPKMHSVGTLGQIPSNVFSDKYSYVALGHIHKPQVIKHYSETIVKYAGSVIPMNFSERDDAKEVTIIQIEQNKLSYQIEHVPVFRPLMRIKGSCDEVIHKLKNISTKSQLKPWLEIIITEKGNFLEFNQILSDLSIAYGFEVLSRNLEIKNQLESNIRDSFVNGLDNNPLDDVDAIFKLRCDKAGLSEDNFLEMNKLFEEVKECLNSTLE